MLDCDDDMDGGPPFWLWLVAVFIAVSVMSAAFAILLSLGYAAHSLWAAWL